MQVEGLQSLEDRKQIWLGLANDDHEQFRRVNERLMIARDGHVFKRIPSRLYFVDQTPGASATMCGKRGAGGRVLCVRASVIMVCLGMVS